MLRATHLLRGIQKIDISVVRVRVAFRIFAGVLGALHTYAAVTSQSMNADGINYLDIGDAYFRGDWANAINVVWSPLYSWILGLVNFIFRPSMAWEFPTLHIVNFLLFLMALVSFEFMWSSIRIAESETTTHTLSEPFWWTLGYLLFIWTFLSLIQIWHITPDMLMGSFVLLAAGLVARIRLGDADLRVLLRLGLVLGLGYLSKTIMFPIALVFLVLAWLVQGWTWTSLKKVLPATLVFLLISVPYIAVISNAKGKLTYGETGRVTYIRHVLRIPYPHWQGDPTHNIIPIHPSRVLHRSPEVYEFGDPIGGTYPISLDASYWYEGIPAAITLSNLLTPLTAGGLSYLELFLEKQGILLACVLVLYTMRQQSKRTLSEGLRRWALVIPAVIAFVFYAFVLVEDRYVGVFILLFWADILANIRLSEMPNGKVWLNTFSIVAAFGLLANIILFNLDGFLRLNPSINSKFVELSALPARPLAVAESLQALGIQQGDKVGVIGYAYDSYWARLARVKIVAEMLDADAEQLWRGDDALQQSVLQAFVGAEVEAVVAEYVPGYANVSNWHQVGDSNFYIYTFPEQ